MTKERIKLGVEGEALALQFLMTSGYKILEKNYRNKFGEIDLVARDGDTICFIEVKTRVSENHGTPFEAVTFFKKRKLIKVALWYLKIHRLEDVRARFDVVGVGGPLQENISIIKNAFDLADAGF